MYMTHNSFHNTPQRKGTDHPIAHRRYFTPYTLSLSRNSSVMDLQNPNALWLIGTPRRSAVFDHDRREGGCGSSINPKGNCASSKLVASGTPTRSLPFHIPESSSPGGSWQGASYS